MALRDEVRHLLTNRLTLMTHQQNVTWSLFTFFSPSDVDAYFRPDVSYKVNDFWTVTAGIVIPEVFLSGVHVKHRFLLTTCRMTI
jgi:hypothetical protein